MKMQRCSRSNAMNRCVSETASSSQREVVTENQCRSSYKGHTGDTLAPAAEEGRGRPRKVRMSRQQAMIPECPNGATQYVEDVLRYDESIVVSRQASELKHLSSWKRRKQK